MSTDVSVPRTKIAPHMGRQVRFGAGSRLLTTPVNAVAVGAVALVSGMVLFATTIRGIDVEHVGNLGLVAQAGLGYWGALALVLFAFALAILHVPWRRSLPFAPLVVLVVMLYGLAAIPESVGRLQPAWLHAGFIELIARTGRSATGLDARFSWPGVFAFVGFVDKAAAVSTAVTLIRWTPLVLGLAYLLPLWAIATSMVSDYRARWLALWVFTIGNWVGQDYLSPQGFAYLLYLVILAILFRWFRPRGSPRAIWDLARGARPDRGRSTELANASLTQRIARRLIKESRAKDEVKAAWLGRSSRALMVSLLVLLFGACVASHPLTPVFILALMLTLGVAGRITHRGLVALFGMMFGAWLSWGAVTFWSGHHSDVVGGGGPTANIQANLSGRLISGDPLHRVVLASRFAMAVLLIIVAAIGVVRRRRGGHRDNTLILGALVPFPIVLVQAYGGEALLRSYFFALPFLSILGALAFPFGMTPRTRKPSRIAAENDPVRRLCLLLVLSMVGLIGSVTVRYGNERFEMMRPTDLSAVRYIYAHARPGDAILAVNGNLPWQYRDVDRFNYRTVRGNGAPTGTPFVDLVRERAAHGRNYLILTQSQGDLGEILLGLPKGWLAQDQREVDASPSFSLVFRNRSASVYVLVPDRPERDSTRVRTAAATIAPRRVAPGLTSERETTGGTSRVNQAVEIAALAGLTLLSMLVSRFASRTRSRRAQRRRVTRNQSAHRSLSRLAFTIFAVVSCGVAMQQVAYGSGLARGIAVFIFALAAPGYAVIGWTTVRGAALTTSLCLAVSMSLGVLAAQTMLWTHRWSPLTTFWILALGSLVSLGAQIARTEGALAGSGRSSSRDTGANARPRDESQLASRS